MVFGQNNLYSQWMWNGPPGPGTTIQTNFLPPLFQDAEVVIDPDPNLLGFPTVTRGGLRVRNGYSIFDAGLIPVPSPTLGTGTFMYWMANLGALRAGRDNSGTSWIPGINVGLYSFANGFDNIASGDNSVAFGNNSSAIGNSSLAGGSNCFSNALFSFAFGFRNVANSNSSVSFGRNNTVGISPINGIASFAIGSSNTVIDNNSFALGQNCLAKFNQSMAGGSNSQTNADNSFAYGNNAKTDPGADNAAAFGNNTIARGINSFVGGENNSIANGRNSFAFGDNTTTDPAATNAVAFGSTTIAQGVNSLAGGSNNSQAIGMNSIAWGDNVQTIGVSLNAVAFGQSTRAFGPQSLAGGNNFSTANGLNSIAFGDQVQTFGANSVAFGQSTNAAGPQSLAGGSNLSTANGINSIAWGDNVQTSAAALNAVAFGQSTRAIGPQSLAGGNNNTTASGPNSLAFGSNVQTNGRNSVAYGDNTNTIGPHSFAGGNNNTTATGTNSVAIGDNVQSIGDNAVAYGQATIANGFQSLVGGFNLSTANGTNSIAWGDSCTTTLIATNSIALGNRTQVDATESMVGGTASISQGDGSLVWGAGCSIGLGAFNSVSFGSTCQSNAPLSFSGGAGSIADATSGFAFGSVNRVFPTATNGIATGKQTEAHGLQSFSGGDSTRARGNNSFAFGDTVQTNGANSVAFGQKTIAGGAQSLAGGINSIASGPNSIAWGTNCQTFPGSPNGVALGQNVNAIGLNTFAHGESVTCLNNSNVVFGNGGTGTLFNAQNNSFMVGYNSDVPTFFIGSASGPGTTGNVGIGGSGYLPLLTPNPLEKLEVWNGNIRQMSLDLVLNPTASSFNTGYNNLGLSTSTCPLYGLTTDNNNLSLTNPIPGIANSFVQVGVDATGPAVNWDANSLLTFNIDANITSCTPTKVMELGNHPLGYSLVLYGLGWSTVGAWTGSDIRFKDNISDIENPFDVLSKLKGKSYNFRYNEFPKYNFDDKRTFGFIAQELQEVLPEAVRMGPDSFLAVNYMTLIPYLCEGIKIHHEEIEKLKNASEFQNTNSEPTISDSVKINLEKQVDSMKVLNELQTTKIDSLEQVLTENIKETQEIKEKLNSLIACLSTKGLCETIETKSASKDEPFLGQNTPNPFANETVIPYYLPEGSQNAMIEVYNSNSNVVYKFVNLETGHGSVQINHQGVNGEVLYYRLIIDGKVFKVLKMLRIE
jgi:hypothetical protein